MSLTDSLTDIHNEITKTLKQMVSTIETLGETVRKNRELIEALEKRMATAETNAETLRKMVVSERTKKKTTPPGHRWRCGDRK